MNINKKILVISLLAASLTLVNLVTQGQGQNCKNSYNNTLGYFNKGQFEYVNSYLNECVESFKSKEYYDYFRNNENGINTVFKVYKLIITSYKKLEQESLAVRKMNELVVFFENKFSRDVVVAKLNSTLLTLIDSV